MSKKNSDLKKELDGAMFGPSSSEKDSSKDISPSFSENAFGEEVIQSPYKYLEVEIFKEDHPNEYLIYVHHQSHGFLNYLVSKLLKVKGVKFAAYKYTSLDDPNIFIKLDGSKDIKAVLKEATKLMRIELTGLKNAIIQLKL